MPNDARPARRIPQAERNAGGLSAVVALMRAAACQRNLGLHETRVLVLLASFADAEGLARPPRSLLAAMTGICEAHIRRAVRNLSARGFVDVAEAATRKRTNRYRLHFQAILDGATGMAVDDEGRIERVYRNHPVGVPDKAPHADAIGCLGRNPNGVPVEAPIGGLGRHPGGASTGTPEVPQEDPLRVPREEPGDTNWEINRGSQGGRSAPHAARSPMGAAHDPRRSLPGDVSAMARPSPHDDLRRLLGPQITDRDYRSWFGGVQIDRSGTAQRLIAPSRFIRDHIRAHFGDMLRETLGGQIEIEVRQ